MSIGRLPAVECLRWQYNIVTWIFNNVHGHYTDSGLSDTKYSHSKFVTKLYMHVGSWAWWGWDTHSPTQNAHYVHTGCRMSEVRCWTVRMFTNNRVTLLTPTQWDKTWQGVTNVVVLVVPAAGAPPLLTAPPDDGLVQRVVRVERVLYPVLRSDHS